MFDIVVVTVLALPDIVVPVVELVPLDSMVLAFSKAANILNKLQTFGAQSVIKSIIRPSKPRFIFLMA